MAKIELEKEFKVEITWILLRKILRELKAINTHFRKSAARIPIKTAKGKLI